jgi:hypothetical protein
VSALLLLLGAGGAWAGELLVQAPVLSVEPLNAPAREELDCPPKPEGTLGTLLRWDLGLSCERRLVTSGEIEGYRVVYRWDNRVHERVMDRDPGESVALRLKVD